MNGLPESFIPFHLILPYPSLSAGVPDKISLESWCFSSVGTRFKSWYCSICYVDENMRQSTPLLKRFFLSPSSSPGD
jgi:hypothetical protein